MVNHAPRVFAASSTLLYSAPVIFSIVVAVALMSVPLGAAQGASPPTGSATTAPSPSVAPSRPPETLDASLLHPGQRAVVRTVFQGSLVEEFDAEIVGVLKGGGTEGDMIIGRALSERVVKSGVAQGMSGSPVYVDGKLIGALSSGWPFSREPVFGITPIREMLDVFDHPTPASVDATAGPAGLEVGLATGTRFGAFHWNDPAEDGRTASAAETPAGMPAAPSDRSGVTSATRLTALPLPLACSGLDPVALDAARRWLEPFGFSAVPGGKAADGGPPAQSLEPGSAVAVDLLRGDLQISAIGTVTYRDGDKVLLFGHPFFQSGDIRLPMATAEITTVIASDLFSFKMGARGRSVGVVTQDRRTALAGRIGLEPHMLPLAITVGGFDRTPQRFRFESVEDRTLAPNLIAIAALNSLLESGGMNPNQTLRWTLSLYRAGRSPLVMSDVEAGEGPAMDAVSSIASPISFLLNNPFRRLALDSVTVRLASEPGRDQWTLRAARLLAARVRPGAPLIARCEIERWRGARETRDFRFDVPEELPDGRYVLWLGGATELTRYEAQHLPGRYRPTSLDDAWQRLGHTRPSDGLYGVLLARAPEVTVDGRDYPELPVSALSVLSSDQSAGDRSRVGDLAELGEQRMPLSGLVRGEIQVAFQVDSKAP